ncbi:hypothetical protein LINPERHAP1_LOCUS20201 [Linum perenne]
MASNQQQPARPWFRVASLARPAPPQPQSPAPAIEVTAPAQPRPFRNLSQPPPVTRPALQPTQPPPPPRPASVPPTPVVRTTGVAAPSSSVPSSPTKRVIPTPGNNVANTSSLPSSPLTKSAAAPTTVSSVPASPIRAPPKPAASTFSVPNSPVRNNPISAPNSPKPAGSPPAIKTPPQSPDPKPTAAPPPSPRDIKPAAATPPQSPKTKPIVRPPSPLSLPPTQFKSEFNFPPEAEQKTVVVQNKAEKNHSTTHKLWSSHETGKNNNPTKSEAKGTKIITIAGENKGATMELFRTPPRKSPISSLFPGNPNYLQGNSETSSGSGEEEDGKEKKKNRDLRKKNPMSAVMNSNVQGINNSIMFNSSCSHHDPGVHLALSRKPGGGGKDRRSSNGYQS